MSLYLCEVRDLQSKAEELTMRRRKGRKRPSPHQQPMPISTPSQRLIQYFFSPTINLVHTRVPLSVDHPTPLFFSLPLFWSHQYSCHPLTHVQSNSTFTFSRLICRCFHHFSGLPTTILTLFCFLSKPCLFHSPFFLQFPLLKFHCFLLFCECFFTGYVIHFHCLLQFQLQSSLQDVEDECLSLSNERDENSGGVPVSIDFLP